MPIRLKFPAPKSTPSHFGSEVSQQTRRITGVTPKILHGFQETPAKWIPKSRAFLKSLAGGKKMGKK